MILRTHKTGRREATSAVSFAVVAPVFFVMILGIIEFSRAFMVLHLMTNAARNGARTAVIEGKTYTDISNAAINSLTSQGISGEGVTIQVNDVTDTAANFVANPGDEVTVVVSVPANNVSWVPGTRYLTGGTLTARYTLRRE